MKKTVLAVSLSLGAVAQAGEMQLADNQSVLAAWAQAGGQPAALVDDDKGGTRMEWHNSVSLDAYHTEASGGSLLTPLTTGDYQNLSVSSNFIRQGAGGQTTTGLLGFSVVNDRSVARNNLHIGTLQMSHAQSRSRLVLGDVAASYSSLGVNLGLRGVQMEQKLGQATISGVLGSAAESWETLTGAADATSPRRDVAAVQVEMPVGIEGLRTSASFATHHDNDASLPSQQSTPLTMSGQVGTFGLAWNHARYQVTMEAGHSAWDQSGGASGNDNAMVLDAAWRAEKLSLRTGWHDVGARYASLSGQAQGGVSEAYVAGNWQARDWFTLNTDLRHSENNRVLSQVPVPAVQPASSSDRVMLGAGFQFPRWPGLSLQLSTQASLGENKDGSNNRNHSGSAMFMFTREDWYGNLGSQLSRVDNDAPSASSVNGDITTISAGVGRRWPELAGWMLDLGLNANNQRQSLDNGQHTESQSGSLNLAANHDRAGQVSLNAMKGTVTNPVSGSTLDQTSLQFDYRYPLGRHGQLGLYWRDVSDLAGSSALESTSTTWGLKYAGSF